MMPLKPLKTYPEAFANGELAPMYHMNGFEGRSA